jgi:hypothetical protein
MFPLARPRRISDLIRRSHSAMLRRCLLDPSLHKAKWDLRLRPGFWPPSKTEIYLNAKAREAEARNAAGALSHTARHLGKLT